MKKVAGDEKGKMLVVEIRFWRHIGGGRLKIKEAGIAVVQISKYHDIKEEKAVFFNSLNDVPKAIEKALKKHGVVIHLLTK